MKSEEPMCYITYAVPARLLSGIPTAGVITPVNEEKEEPTGLFPSGFMPEWFLQGSFPEDDFGED